MAELSASAEAARIGRFDIVRVLGRGGQGTVYLAQDTHLERSVALKALRPAAGDLRMRIDGIRRMFAEARAASKLLHPNVVTLFDAGEERGAPYLVFEYVKGRTLAQLLREGGRIAPTQAVEITLQLLQGLAYAHAAGIVHRDLKPANIMLATDGTPRIMDFGIAGAHLGTSAEREEILGSPGYMAPEAVAHKKYSVASDLFSVGAILYEMLTAERAIRGISAADALRCTLEAEIEPPSRRSPQVEATLDAIVMTSLAKNPAHRYTSAAAMADALSSWLRPEVPATKEGGRAALEFLLLRMRHRGDFPALATTIAAVNAAAESEEASSELLCSAILRDFALTKKLLHHVNSPYYRRHGGTITTVSRAVTIVGVHGIRSIALCLALFEHLGHQPAATALREEIIAAYFSGVLARLLSRDLAIGNAEEAFICAMFRGLGRLLVTFYLHEEAQAIARLVVERRIDQARASAEVLGISFEELGIGIARRWNFPVRILESMHTTDQLVSDRAAFELHGLRALSALANSLSDALRQSDEAERVRTVEELALAYGAATGLTSPALIVAVKEAAETCAHGADAFGFSLARSSIYESARAMKSG